MYNQPPLPPYSYGPPIYPSPAPRRRFPIVRVTLLIAVPLILIVGYFSHFIFTTKHIDGYLNSEDDTSYHAIRYLSWTEANGQISGYWSLAEVRGNQRPNYGSGNITGVHNGNNISITFRLNIDTTTTYTDAGTLENDTLTLQAPMPNGTLSTLVYQGVTENQYEQALSDFKMEYGG